MKTIKLHFKSPPFSLNKAYYLKSFSGKTKTKVRTKECRQWGDQILQQLQEYTRELEKFKKAFKPTKHAVKIKIVHTIPEHIFYTKTGEISLFSQDLTNIEKMLVDLIFDSRFNGRQVYYEEVYNLDLNDKYIGEMLSRKQPGDDYFIDVKIERVTLDQLYKRRDNKKERQDENS